MPKRRVTAKQRAASRQNLVKARAAQNRRGVPQGKSVLLVHFTRGVSAAKIVREQRFRPNPNQANVGHVFGTPWRNRNDKQFRGTLGYGHAGVTFAASRKAVKRDSDWLHPQSRMVPASAIHGRIKRLGRRVK